MSPPVFKYGPKVLWEVPIQSVARLFISPGDTVLDIGSNTGGLAIAFARMTGPEGMVIGFECNPRMLEWARANAEVNEAPQINVLDRACFHTADLELKFFAEESTFGVGSSLVYSEGDGQFVSVKTTTVDKECSERGLSPTFVKIDVEGAEVDVLAGMSETIKRCQPVIVIERQNNLEPERDPLNVLLEKGYAAFDVNTMDRVERGWKGWDFATNILAIPVSKKLTVTRREPLIVHSQADGKSAETPVLSAGTAYMVQVEIDCENNELAELEVIDPSGERVLFFNAGARQLADPTCSDFPLHAEVSGVHQVRVDGPLSIRRVRIAILDLA